MPELYTSPLCLKSGSLGCGWVPLVFLRVG